MTFLSGAIAGFLGVAIGAFGAHALKPALIQSGKLEVFELAVKYQFYHALALLLVGVMMNHNSGPWLPRSALGFVTGMILFSGSLYALAFVKLGAIAIVTPIGGLCFIMGWGSLIAAIVKQK